MQLRVVRGTPTAEEIAALVTVVVRAGGRPAGATTSGVRPPARSRWRDSALPADPVRRWSR